MASLVLLSLLYIVIASIMFTRINSISLPMIPINSPKLQILPRTMNSQHHLQFLMNISMARAASYTMTRDSNSSTNSLQGTVHAGASGFYATQVFLGTSSYLMSPYLIIDSADRTWMQCDGCNPCFQIRNGNVRPQASPTYRRLSVDDPRCNPKRIYHQSCGYKSFYGEATSSSGPMGTDTFIFINAETQQPQHFPGLAFGCGLENQNIEFGLNTGPNNFIAGVFGLAPGPQSFINQLDAIIKGRFTYCLTSWRERNPSMSTIKFGDNAQIGGPNVIHLPLDARKSYHLFFRGVSVDNRRVPLHPSHCDLQYKPSGSVWKGFFIDSGSPYTVLPQSAYQPFKIAMVSYFARYGWRPFKPEGMSFDICYTTWPKAGQSFPSVVFHFAGRGLGGREVDWVMTNDNMFIAFSFGFCVVVAETPDPGPCIFGAYQQSNFRILYDLQNWVLSFAPERCQENRPLYDHLDMLHNGQAGMP